MADDTTKHDRHEGHDHAKMGGWISVHVMERYLPIGHPDQRGHAYGPYRTEEEAEADDKAHPCDCFSTLVFVHFPPGFVPISLEVVVIEDTGEELKPEPPVDGQN